MNKFILILSLVALATTASLAAHPDTFQGQPVGTTMSPDNANAYINDTIHSWFGTKLPNTNPKLQPQDVITLADTFKRLGVTNLLASYSQTKGDIIYRVNAESSPADDVKRAVLQKAISTIATENDIPAILAVYDQRPLILTVLIDHQEWDSNIHVTDFLTGQLDQIRDAYTKSDEAPLHVLELAARNPSPAVRAKFDALIADAAQNPDGYDNAHIFLALLTVYIETPNPTIAAHLPDIFTTLAHVAQSQVSDPYKNISTNDVFYRLEYGIDHGNTAQVVTDLFSDPKTKDAVLKLTEVSGSESPFALVPAAACGKKGALVKLVDFVHSASDPSATPAPGYGAMELGLTRHYLKTVVTDRPGDKTKQIADHINDAVYDPVTCLWAIPNEDGTMPVIPKLVPTTNSTPVAPPADSSIKTSPQPTPTVPTPEPPAQVPPVVTPQAPQAPDAATNVAPAPAPKVLTATVIHSTTIKTTTPSGGHAAIPLNIGDKLSVLNINSDGTVTARRTDYNFEGQVPKADINIEN